MRSYIGWSLLALIVYLFCTCPFWWVVGGLAASCIAFNVALAGRDRWKAHQYRTAVSKPALQAAVTFWVHVFRWENSGYGIKPEKLLGFQWALERALASAHVQRGLKSYPEIGIFYHAPHNFGLDPLMTYAGESCGIAYGGILECSLAHVHMRITDEQIQITGTLGPTDWRTIWRKGDEPSVTIMEGHNWSCKCGKREHADLTTQLVNPYQRFAPRLKTTTTQTA